MFSFNQVNKKNYATFQKEFHIKIITYNDLYYMYLNR